MALYEGVILEFPITLVSSGTLAANTTIKMDTNGKAANTGSGDIALGWIDRDYANGDLVTVLPLTGLCMLKFGGTTAIGDYVKPGASGLTVVETTASTPTAFTLGQSVNVGANGAVSFVFARA